MLGNHIIDTIVNRVGLQLKNWLSVQQDRAQTNKACLHVITEDYPDAQHTKNCCCTHGLSNSGKQILGKNIICNTHHHRQIRREIRIKM